MGEDRATIEVELFHPKQDNVVIFRQIDRDGKSVWTINGKRSGLREVERAVAEFRIQVTNGSNKMINQYRQVRNINILTRQSRSKF